MRAAPLSPHVSPAPATPGWRGHTPLGMCIHRAAARGTLWSAGSRSELPHSHGYTGNGQGTTASQGAAWPRDQPLWPPAATGSGHAGLRARSPAARPYTPIPTWQGRASVSPPARWGAGRSRLGASARLPASTAACSCPPPAGTPGPATSARLLPRLRSADGFSLQGPISTELIKLERGREGRKQREKLQKSRDGAASLPDPPGPSGLGRGGHAAGTARGERAFPRGCSAACGTGELPGSGKPHRISAPSRFGCEANLAPRLACSRPGVPG